MATQPLPQERQTDPAESFLSYAGIAGIAISLVLTAAVVWLTVGPALVPSGMLLAPGLFTLLLVMTVIAARRIGDFQRPDV